MRIEDQAGDSFVPSTPLLDRLRAEYAEAATAILPWSLNIADCWFLASAFGAGGDQVSLRRVEMLDGTLTDEPCASASVYDIYGADREAGDFELALVAPTARAFCYWDQWERFVLLAGSEQFLQVACPYPSEIEKHRFVETSWEMEGMSD